MTKGAQARKTLGIVISGRCRDIAEHRASSYPVFAKGQSTLGQKGFTRPSALNVSLQIRASDEWPVVEVRPGDWIVADQDGVVCVSQEMMEEVKGLCAKGRREDELCRVDIEAGKGVQASFERHRT